MSDIDLVLDETEETAPETEETAPALDLEGTTDLDEDTHLANTRRKWPVGCDPRHCSHGSLNTDAAGYSPFVNGCVSNCA